MILPGRGLGEWDRAGADLHDADGLAAFLAELDATLPDTVSVTCLDCHINDPDFARATLATFGGWCADGTVVRPDPF